MAKRIRTVLAIGPIHGGVESLERLLEQPGAADADAIAVVGDLCAPWSTADTYRAIFRALGKAEKPTFWVPGRYDAPIREYLSEAHSMEIAFPLLRGVHGTFALASGQVVFAGMGGEIVDDPDAFRAEEYLVRYPGWEAEYRLKVVREVDELPQKVLLFATAPAHKGLREGGSEIVSELIKTYNPRVAVVGGDSASQRQLAKTLVVSPGRADQGHALVDIQDRAAELVSHDGQIGDPGDGTTTQTSDRRQPHVAASSRTPFQA